MRGLAEANNFILIYPEAIATLVLEVFLGLIKLLVECQEMRPFLLKQLLIQHSNYSVDLNRIYACGYSEGGVFSYELACRLNNKIAGIASVSGSMLSESEGLI